MQRYQIKAWESEKNQINFPTQPHESFSVYGNGEKEALRLVRAMVESGYPHPVVIFYGPHGPEVFSN